MAKLKNTTWTLNDSPCKTLRTAAGCWVDAPRTTKNGKVGKQHSSLVKFKSTDLSK
jgi:hypothetical protein